PPFHQLPHKHPICPMPPNSSFETSESLIHISSMSSPWTSLPWPDSRKPECGDGYAVEACETAYIGRCFLQCLIRKAFACAPEQLASKSRRLAGDGSGRIDQRCV